MFEGRDLCIDPDVRDLLDKMIVWAEHQDEILALYLYGSHAQGRATGLSDVDIALLVIPDLSKQLLWHLEGQATVRWSEVVDLRLLNLAPLPFRYEITIHGYRFWSRDFAVVADWESLTWRLYWDLRPRIERYWRQHVIQIMEQKSETERRQYQAALAKVRAVHRRVREAAARYNRDLPE
ncbi:MAG: type VII toxin-antitoxin system MntA family adenylyltransferase antitoxin [Anaerolineae bacterium]